jgi:putative membrane protein
MSLAANIVVALLALIHIYIMVLEMFMWDKPAGLRAFGLPQELATATKVLGANQGLYNGFLAAGMLWGLWLGAEGFGVKVFFLLCVWVAGIYGAATAARKILYVQTVPATPWAWFCCFSPAQPDASLSQPASGSASGSASALGQAT